MKTLDEVIEVYEICAQEQSCVGCPYIETDIDGKCLCGDCTRDALSYLKEYRTLQYGYVKAMADLEDNPALSWDELKQMEGKPVWVEKKHSNLYYMWGLVARIKRYQGHEYAVIKCPDLCNSPMSNIRLYDTMYLNDGWQAYRKERK